MFARGGWNGWRHLCERSAGRARPARFVGEYAHQLLARADAGRHVGGGGIAAGGANIGSANTAVGRAHYFSVPRGGLIPNMYASMQYASPTVAIPGPSRYRWEISLWRATASISAITPPIFRSAPSISLAIVRGYSMSGGGGGGFPSGADTSSAVPVDAGD
jgi:hypothetical protein